MEWNIKKMKEYILLVGCLLLFILGGSSLLKYGWTKMGKGDCSEMIVKKFNCRHRFAGNVYVISSEKGTILIDPGYYDSEIKEYIDQKGGLDAILLTHGHWDHIYDLDQLKADFQETPVYICEDDYDFLTHPELNCSITNGFRLVIESEAERIKEGELKIGEYDIEIIQTPGHTKGSVMYYFKNENMLFTGDTILKDVTGPTFRPTGSEEDMKNSVEKFKKLSYASDTPVYPGHGDVTSYEYMLTKNKDVKEN